jgi:TPR repeat protein
MKKIIVGSLLAVFAFAGHGESDDPGMKLLIDGDKVGALKTFEKECDNDKNAWACGNAGLMLYMGMAGKADPAKSKEYYNKGCKLHDIASCENLAEIAYREQNIPAAKGYFQKVCKMKKYAKNKLDMKTVAQSCKRAESIK